MAKFKNLWLNLWRGFSSAIKPIEGCNANPILYAGSKGHFMKFGLYSGIGAAVGVFFALFYMSAKGIVIPNQLWMTFIFGACLMWACARLFYLISLGKAFFSQPVKYLCDTGLFGQGGTVGAISFFMYLAYHLNIPLDISLDAVAYGAAIALAIGRIGCYNYGCCWGAETHADFGVTYTHPQAKVLRAKPELKGLKLYPVQLMTTLIDLCIFLILTILLLLNVYNGVVGILYVFLQQGGRLWIEGYRDDEVVQGKHNWVITAFGLFILALPLLLLLIFWEEGYPYLSPSIPPVAPHIVADFFNTLLSPAIWACVIIFGTAVAFLYGWHGKQIGSWTAK